MIFDHKYPYFAEIIESSLNSWRVQSWKWDTFPPFGSLIVIESPHRLIFGIVSDIITGSIDPTRYPLAYQKTQEELMQEQPQIFEFLRTNFICHTVGYQENGPLIYQLAPQPPKIHAFARAATTQESSLFFADNRYLPLLFDTKNQNISIDELLLAILAERTKKQPISLELIHDFVDHYSLLTGNDYRRLKLFLQRAQNFFIDNFAK